MNIINIKILSKILANWIQHTYSGELRKMLRLISPSLVYIYLATCLVIYHVNMINQVRFVPEIQIWFNIIKHQFDSS